MCKDCWQLHIKQRQVGFWQDRDGCCLSPRTSEYQLPTAGCHAGDALPRIVIFDLTASSVIIFVFSARNAVVVSLWCARHRQGNTASSVKVCGDPDIDTVRPCAEGKRRNLQTIWLH
ncbi:hypothetical protein WOLCODRAFT_124391 [Wolfiporia cocos MD-104 SS10]|uniref:Uncharacterized protein n=1 Tax=Wolfiporia cocos (strain MD-104) TaxID=742152 RepID=A0A2H3JY88_WOLCO|nr:hypothetical protein WOLCODRAFT_124391 [Wolfiporia cocos MD-104 SS10]